MSRFKYRILRVRRVDFPGSDREPVWQVEEYIADAFGWWPIETRDSYGEAATIVEILEKPTEVI